MLGDLFSAATAWDPCAWQLTFQARVLIDELGRAPTEPLESMDASKDQVIAAFLLGLDTFSYQGAGRPLTW